MSKIKPVGKPKVILKENFAENYKNLYLKLSLTLCLISNWKLCLKSLMQSYLQLYLKSWLKLCLLFTSLYLGKDSCQGDSGGPLVYRAFSDDPWTQVGIVRWFSVTWFDYNGA